MKIILTTMLLLSTATVFANDYVCKETKPKGKVAKEVVVTLQKNITDSVSYGKKYDSVYTTHVQINNLVGKSKAVVKSFYAIATSEDVLFNISAVKANGFKMWIYLDELNESGIVLTDAKGKKTTHNLDCTPEEDKVN